MGEYVLNSPMLSIPMGGADVVLGVQWLQYWGMVAISRNFLEFFFRRKGIGIMGYHKEAEKDNKL